MAKKYVRDTKAAQAIAATVVLDKRGVQVATVHEYYSPSGSVLVDIFTNSDRALERNAKALGLSEPIDAIHQQGKASGYGYDKAAAAMSGLYVDGIRLTDHCGRSKASERLFARYIKDIEIGGPACAEVQKAYDEKARKIGAHFANREVVTRGDHRPLIWTQVDYNRETMMPHYGYVLRDDYDRSADTQIEYDGPIVTRYGSLFVSAGLEALRLRGYRIIRAI